MTPFTVADMELKTAPEIIAATEKAAKHGIFGYTSADESYRQAFVRFMKKQHDVEINPEWLVISAGIVPALFVSVRALTAPGDGVIIQPPVYPPFYHAVEDNGRHLLLNPLRRRNGRYEIDFEGFEALAKKPEAKMFILCSPHNPVGRIWTEEDLTRIGQICAQNGVVVLSDEIHGGIPLNGHTHKLFLSLGDECKNNCVVCTALSKTYNIAGLSCSNILIPNRDLREAFIKQQNIDCIGGMNYFAYAASMAAFEMNDDWRQAMLEVIWENYIIVRDFFSKVFPSIVVYEPEGTYLVWIDMNGWGMTEESLTTFLREKALLAANIGSTFGKEGTGFIRFNLAAPKSEIYAALERIRIAGQNAGLR